MPPEYGRAWAADFSDVGFWTVFVQVGTPSETVYLSGRSATRRHETAGQKLGGPNLQYSGGTRTGGASQARTV
ncbi:hypothetical protein GCM10009560_51160 [Nonomuraea longicatena]|uniref:Uncharacterized protein n=1 Tax=Nonomuraea longicatena TaxID=83682 RepID=A0ABP4AR03_9ACTN